MQQAQLNLGYTTITTPVTGLSSYAQVQDGAYVSGANSLLTYVAQIDSLWVNFSVSENDMLKFRTEKDERACCACPTGTDFVVDLVLSDGSIFPHQGRITFANADYDVKTGTFLLRATVPNPDLTLRPGQFVRVRLSGAVRPNAILVPQEAVLQGAKGHFVMLVGKDDKAQPRPVEVGPWHGNDWFITGGLAAGDVVVTDGVAHLAPGAKVKIVATAPAAVADAPDAAPPAAAPPPGVPTRRRPARPTAEVAAETDPMFSHFFIDRPIFAAVIALVIYHRRPGGDGAIAHRPIPAGDADPDPGHARPIPAPTAPWWPRTSAPPSSSR